MRFDQLRAQEPETLADLRVAVSADQEILLWDFLSDAQRDDVAAYSGTLDVSDALSAAIASVTYQGNAIYPVTGRIVLPRGKLRFGSEVYIESAVHLIGHAGGATQIVFDADKSGFIVAKGNASPNTSGGDGSIFDGLTIIGSGTNSEAHGVDMKGRARMRYCTVRGFGGNGLNIRADVAIRSNANLWSAEFCECIGNGLSGIYTDGGDANAGNVIGGNFSDNGSWGIWDDSFLGNTYIGAHADGNGRRASISHEGNRYYCIDAQRGGTVVPGTDDTCWVFMAEGSSDYYYPAWVSGGAYLEGGAYKATGANARNAFIGCYSESGTQPPSLINYPATVEGGLHAAGLTGTGVFYVDGKLPALTSLPTSTGGYIQIGVGASGDRSAVLSLHDPVASGALPYRLKYRSGAWYMDWANLNGTSVLHLYNRDATPANGFARDMSSESGGIGLPNGFYLGSQMISITCGDSKPADGTGKVGDLHINTATIAGGWSGWRRIAAGGAWKGFGEIEA